MTATLVLRDSDHRWTFEILEGKPAVLGHFKSADVCIPDMSISKFHARIYRNPEDGQWYVEDLGTKTGISVNMIHSGEYGKLQLQAGDILRLGCLEFSVAVRTEA